jgi:hypothetical protein
MLKFILLFLISSSALAAVPEGNIQLINGIIDGYGLLDSLGVKNCEKEFKDLIYNSLNDFDSLIEYDFISLTSYFFKMFYGYEDVAYKCPDFSKNLKRISAYNYKTYKDPRKFLVGVLSNVVSLTIMKEFYGLKDKISEGKFYKAGLSFGIIMKVMLDVNQQGQKIFLENDDECSDVLTQVVDQVIEAGRNLMEGNFKGLDIGELSKNLKKIKDVCFKL